MKTINLFIIRALVFVISILSIGCARSVVQAYNSTPIFSKSRHIYQVNGKYLYRFHYRGVCVTYRPNGGATIGKHAANPGSIVSVSDLDNNFPTRIGGLANGCLVFACAKAERIERGLELGVTRSEVIAFVRTGGTKHAIVIYNKNGKTIAEDDFGYVAVITNWKARSPAQALLLATMFTYATHVYGSPQPLRARFVGKF